MAGNGPRRHVTMSDVAQRAGVSATTVSHVLNRTRTVAPQTEEAVLSAVAALGYMPDDVVRSMRTASNRTIGLAMAAMSHTYFGDVIHVIERTLSQAGFTPLLADTHDDGATELRAVGDLLSRRVDGLILAPSADPRLALEFAASQGIPVTLIDRTAPFEVDSISCESVEPTAELVDHLASLGHRRIAMIGGKAGLSTSEDRIAGYRLGMSRNGLEVDETLVRDGGSTGDGGSQAFHAIWAAPDRPTAVVVGNNQMTIGALAATHELGIRIPDDIALVAFDDFPWADYFRPGLTVMAQPLQTMGEQAARMILARLEDPDAAVQKVLLRPRFMHRESCGCTPAPRAPQSEPSTSHS